jgi:capsular polysaccharide transport system permease protein
MREQLKRLWQLLRRHPIMEVALLASALGAGYWFLWASDRFVSEAHVIIQRTELSGGTTFDLSSLLSGGSSSGSKPDQMLLRDHLMSVDMLNALDAKLKLRDHYSDGRHDILSRMWFRNAPTEVFHEHYLSRVSVEFDDYSGVLVIKAQAYDPLTAQAIATSLVSEGERFMNSLAHNLAQSQVAFLERQVNLLADRATQARQVLLIYQNRRGLPSPQATAETIGAIVARLQAQRAELETQRGNLQSYLVSGHPSIVQVNQQIASVDRQIALEQGKLAAPTGNTLNRTVEEYQRLEMQAGFALDIYKTALTALEQGRIEATRTLKQMSVVQSPPRPEKSMEPRRAYNSVVFLLVALLLAGVAQLLISIMRDHKD